MTREEFKKAMRDTKKEIVLKNLHKLFSLVKGYPEYEDCISYAIEELEQEHYDKQRYVVRGINNDKIEFVDKYSVRAFNRYVKFIKNAAQIERKTLEQEPITKNNLDTINGLNDFIEFGKKAFGVELTVKKSDNPDSYNKLFRITKNDLEVLDKIRAEITDCLKALDEIEKTGLNIYLPNEISGRRLTYQQCLGFIDKYKAETENS